MINMKKLMKEKDRRHVADPTKLRLTNMRTFHVQMRDLAFENSYFVQFVKANSHEEAERLAIVTANAENGCSEGEDCGFGVVAAYDKSDFRHLVQELDDYDRNCAPSS
jgi:hypothetical protein